MRTYTHICVRVTHTHIYIYRCKHIHIIDTYVYIIHIHVHIYIHMYTYTAALTQRTLLPTQDGVPPTSNYVAWPAGYFRRRSTFILLIYFFGVIPRAAPLALWVLADYGEEGLDGNCGDAGSGSNFCPTTVHMHVCGVPLLKPQLSSHLGYAPSIGPSRSVWTFDMVWYDMVCLFYQCCSNNQGRPPT